GQVGGGQGGVADAPAGELEGPGHEVQVEIVGLREAWPEVDGPQLAAIVFLGQGEADDGVEAAGEGVVHVGPQVGGEDGQPVEQLHALEEVGNLDVGVAVVGGLDVGTLPE